ncbi:hypothetical protein EDB83DRAFT_2521175 [Lactarius deliciosus]|nr:hypothetical protein EDB83DRAFT_2521175 [Lactarius deliciosus]
MSAAHPKSNLVKNNIKGNKERKYKPYQQRYLRADTLEHAATAAAATVPTSRGPSRLAQGFNTIPSITTCVSKSREGMRDKCDVALGEECHPVKYLKCKRTDNSTTTMQPSATRLGDDEDPAYELTRFRAPQHSASVTFQAIPPKGGKGGKSKVAEAPTTEVKGFQTCSTKAGLKVCLFFTHLHFALARSAPGADRALVVVLVSRWPYPQVPGAAYSEQRSHWRKGRRLRLGSLNISRPRSWN